MTNFLTRSAAVNVILGPFVDATDATTAETGLAGTMSVRVSKNGAAFAARNSAGAITHSENGYYIVPLDATDTNTLGRLVVAVSDAAHRPVVAEYEVGIESADLARVNTYPGLYGNSIWLTTGAVGGTVVDVNGTVGNPVPAWADAINLNTTLSYDRYTVRNGEIGYDVGLTGATGLEDSIMTGS